MPALQKTKDGSFTLFSESYNQTYHSIHGSITESRHVFLDASKVLKRMNERESVEVLEVGFGTGLNFFLTADAALRYDCRLTYWAFEKDLLPADTMKSLEFDKHLTEPSIYTEWLLWREGLEENALQGLRSWIFNDSLSLHLLLGDATITPLPASNVDAIYLDAFSPDQNPELWTISFLKKMHGALRPDGVLTTYSAKSLVRKNLNAAGFETLKLPGPPGKREMLLGKKVFMNRY